MGYPTKIDRNKSGTLIQTSLLKDLVMKAPTRFGGPGAFSALSERRSLQATSEPLIAPWLQGGVNNSQPKLGKWVVCACV